MLSVAGRFVRAGCRRQENCVQISPGGARFPLRQQRPAGQTRRGRQPGAVTVAYAAGSPICSPLDGRIGRPSGESRPTLLAEACAGHAFCAHLGTEAMMFCGCGSVFPALVVGLLAGRSR
jgi:hypothetical protein